jgi:iron complex transport system ATP-binding protein
MSRLEAQRLTLAYDGLPVVGELDLLIPSGAVTALIGPNGCGKSTLLRGLARLLKPRGGAAYLDGVAIATLPTRQVARRIGILPQGPVAPEGLTVVELVAQGRYPHQSWFRQWSENDERIVQEALAVTGTRELAERTIDTLSGGQRQKAWIAMTLAQQTETLLLDEPTTFLDLAHQVEVLDLLHHLNRVGGRTIVMVLHDLNQACRYADEMVALKDGRVFVHGAPGKVVTEEMIHKVFGVECRIVEDPVAGTPLCIPVGSAAQRAAANVARGSVSNGVSFAREPLHES